MIKKYRRPYRVKRKSSILKNRFFWLGILILIVFIGLFYFLVFSSFFQIKEIKISGNQKVSTENLSNLIEEKINQKILFFYSKSIFLADFKEIKKEILRNFPQIQQVNLKRKFPQKIFVQIEEREPIAVFCQAKDCFLIDREGIIFETNVTGSVPVTLRKEDLDSEIKLGEKVIDRTLISQILEIELRLRENFKILTEEVLIVADERLNFKTFEGWEIYFDPKKDLDWQLTKLYSVLEKEIPSEKRGKLEYIELRFGNFAPYKYRSD